MSSERRNIRSDIYFHVNNKVYRPAYLKCHYMVGGAVEQPAFNAVWIRVVQVDRAVSQPIVSIRINLQVRHEK